MYSYTFKMYTNTYGKARKFAKVKYFCKEKGHIPPTYMAKIYLYKMEEKEMKKMLAILVVAVMLLSVALVGCGQEGGTAPESPAAESSAATEASTAPADDTSAAPADEGGVKDVAVLIKATDSDFWQYVLVGATNYAAENPDKVKVTTDGPPNESDIDQQVSILEQIISREPDAIVIASTSSDATVPAIEGAVAKGIPVITVDNKVNTDKVATLLATDNLKGGATAADTLVEKLKAEGKELKGKVGVISNMAGVQVLTDRDQGFIDRMKEIAPDIELIETVYVDGDMTKAMDAAADQISANDDLLGFFADNNTVGSGTARAITEAGKENDLVLVAFDSDPEEIKGLGTGAVDALILQDPYGMGYKGVEDALKAISGETLESYVDTGVTVVTKDNMDDEEIKGLLDPMTKKIG